MVYLLVYSNEFGERQELKEYFNSCSFIEHWRCDMPNSFYLVSENTASEIGKQFKEKFPEARYIITEVSANRQGWLPKATWKFIHTYEEAEE